MKPIMDISGAMIRSTIVVIPAYDPGTVLLDLAEEITAAGYRLIVVDDGSGMDSEPIWEHPAENAPDQSHSAQIQSGQGCGDQDGPFIYKE